MIEYKEINKDSIIVFSERKKVGKIRRVIGGYRYFPLKYNSGGELFKSIKECKKSLEC